MADEPIKRSTSSDLNGASFKEFPRPGKNSGERVKDKDGNPVEREHNKDGG